MFLLGLHWFTNVTQAFTISAGPPAFFSHRASDTQLLLARTGHKVFVRDTHCHIMLARTIIQRADLFPHCRDHFVRNATRLTHRSEFPCYVADIQPHCDPLFKRFKLLKLPDLLKLQELKTYFKFVHSELPTYLLELPFDLNVTIHNHNTRGHKQIHANVVIHEFAKRC